MDTQGTPNADDQGNPEFQIERSASAAPPDMADQPTIILGPHAEPIRSSTQPAPPAEPPKPVAAPSAPAEASAVEPESPIPEAVPSPETAPALATPLAAEAEPTTPGAGPGPSPVPSPSPASAPPQTRTVPVVPVVAPTPLQATGPLAASPTAPRDTHEVEFYEPRSRARPAFIAAALVVLGAAAAGTTYLVLRRRRGRAVRPLSLAAARMRLAQMWSATSATGQAALSRLPSRDRALAPAPWRGKRARFTVARLTAGASLHTMRDTVSRRVADIGSTVRAAAALVAMVGARQAARLRVRAIGERAASMMGDLMGGMMSMMDAVRRVGVERARTYGGSLGAAGSSILAAPQRISGAVRSAFSGRMGRARVVASARVDVGRRAARRRGARLGRRLRWFRRGMYAGAVWGILFAPDSGRATREKLSATFQGLTRRQATTARPPARALHAGSAGPHPLSPTETTHAPFTGVEAAVPFLHPTSEEPLAPPPPDMVEGELPGTPSVS